MAVYRERRRLRPALLTGLVVIGVAVLVLTAALIFFRPSTAPADPLAEARAKAQIAAEGLEVFAIEYPQAAQGAELSGAVGALARAQGEFESARSDLARMDAAAVEQIASDFATLREKVAARAPAGEVIPLADEARELLLALTREQ